MNAPWWFMILESAVALFLAWAGVTLLLNPARFVRGYRKALPGQKVAQTEAWERAVRSPSGRLAVVAFLVCWCVIAWVVYSPFFFQ